MRLRTFESFWLVNDGLLSSYPSLHNKNESAQIVVIGGGITGALVSYSLAQNNKDVILLDKRDIGMGSTAASSSMLQYEIDVPLIELRKLIGEKGANECYLAGVEAIDVLETLIRTNSLECGFERKNSLYVSKKENDAKWLRQECDARAACGLRVKWLDKQTIFEKYGLVSHGGILSESGASVDAYKLTHELIKLSVKKGMKVYDQTEISNIETREDQTRITTKSGCTLTCDKIIFCTGYESLPLFKEKICKVLSTYVCVSEQNILINDHLKKVLVWNTDRPYFYMKTIEGGRLLIGGADSRSRFPGAVNKIGKRKLKQLITQLAELVPDLEFIDDFSWAGTFGSTKDGLPYIGRSPEYKDALFALGFGGNGIVFSVQAMGIINDLLNNRTNSLAYWYRFGR